MSGYDILTAMARRTRRILFLLATMLFIGASYVAIVYAQGYKYSLSENKFVYTGTISLKVSTDAKIFLNDKLHGSTSFIGNSYGIDRLLPGDYKVRLYREGFSSWEKTVSVKEGLRTDFPHILILPTSEEEVAKIVSDIELKFQQIFDNNANNAPAATISTMPTPKVSPRATGSPIPAVSAEPETRLFYIENGNLYQTIDSKPMKIASNVEGFSVSDGNRKIAWWNTYVMWVMWLEDTDYQPFHKKGDVELITRFAAPIERVAWFDAEDHIVVQSNGYKIIEIDKRGGLNIIKL